MATVNCDPQSLVTAAAPFQRLSSTELDWVKTYLLQQIAGNTDTVQALLERARCFACADGFQIQVQNYLLCQNANK